MLAENAGWNLQRRKDANGDTVLSIIRPDWSIRVAGQFDEFLDCAEVSTVIYYRSAQIVGPGSCIEYLEPASRDPHFAAAVALASAYQAQLEAELSGDAEPVAESEAADPESGADLVIPQTINGNDIAGAAQEAEIELSRILGIEE